MLSVASLCVPPTLSDPAVADEVLPSESHCTGEALTQRQGAIKHSTSFKVSHARLDNVTFKTTRECRSRKHISGNLFFMRIMKCRGGKKLVGKNGLA